jgi:hypothetical protein
MQYHPPQPALMAALRKPLWGDQRVIAIRDPWDVHSPLKLRFKMVMVRVRLGFMVKGRG